VKMGKSILYPLVELHAATDQSSWTCERLERVKGIEPSYSAWKGFGG